MMRVSSRLTKDFGTSIFDIQLVLPWHEWKLMQLQKRKAKEFHEQCMRAVEQTNK
jgi:hypothetical protein